jgi:hypothetical protein
MNKIISNYISKAIIDMLDHNIQIKLINKFEHTNMFEADGMFDDDLLLFIVVVADKTEEWFPIFIHEYCHFKQWKEKKFTNKEWINTFTKLYKWIDSGEELDKKEQVLYARRARRAELDCEKRAVEEIKKYNLPINIDKYIQTANAYVFSYNFLVEGNKKLYGTGFNENVTDTMPKKFLSRYDRIPRKYREAIIKLSEEEKNGD